MKIKKSLSILIILFFSTSIFAQITVDPSHDFYQFAQNWYLKGYTKTLPPLRPYSKLYVNQILEDVIENGSYYDAEKAKTFYEELNKKSWNLNLKSSVTSKLNSEKNFLSPFIPLFPSVYGDFSLFNDMASLGYKIGFSGYNTDNEENYRLLYTNSLHDSIRDPATIGSYKFFTDVNTVLTVGNKTIYSQLGINRLGFSPFLGKGIALNDTAYHSSNIVFSFLNEKFSYSQVYSAIGSTTNYDGSGLQPEKYIAFHQFSYKPISKFELTYYETIIFGQRFDPSYFIPTPYMIAQGIGGFADNLQMGILTNYKIFDGFLWATDIFVDDLSINDLVKFNFDTKIRVAAKTGIIYAFDSPIFNKISLDYTLITPYTYAHPDSGEDIYWYTESKYNYQNYTNSGIPIGSTLPPNSDGFNFSFSMNPLKNLNLTFNGFFGRHANSAESLSSSRAIEYLCSKTPYATDGSIFMHQAINNDIMEEVNEHLNFLTQSHKMYIFQLGFTAKYSLPKFKWGALKLNLSYNFEYIHNKGIDSNIYPSGEVNAKYEGNDSTKVLQGYTIGDDSHIYNEKEIVEIYYNKWTSSFYDAFNHYFSIGFEYNF